MLLKEDKEGIPLKKVKQITLPLLFMRTVMQAVYVFPALVDPYALSEWFSLHGVKHLDILAFWISAGSLSGLSLIYSAGVSFSYSGFLDLRDEQRSFFSLY
ncbi:unnamed protein product [Urochloa humidicola]